MSEVGRDGAGSGFARSLEGARVVVVGGTSGMGLGAVRAAAAAGAEVVIAGRRPASERGMADEPGRIVHAAVDVTDEASVRALFDGLGGLDHLLVTAAPAPGAWVPFLEGDIARARGYMDGKFWGSWACARYATPIMSDGGSITFLTGATAIRPRPGLAMVSAAFSALEGFSRALALEVAPIRVNTIRPGLVDSDMWTILDEEEREELRRKAREIFPVARIGTIDDIGQAAHFLMTNPFVTGSILEITGGEQLVEAF